MCSFATQHHTQNANKEWAGKRVLVAGLARSGLAAASLLLRAKAVPVLYDQKGPENFGNELNHLQQAGCVLALQGDIQALVSQADVIVISPGIPMDSPLAVLANQMGIPCVGELELASRFAPGPLFAVTGTNGKTTTVSLLGEMLRQAGRVYRVAGNIGYPLSSAVLDADGDTILVTEVSSFQLESVDSFHPRVAAILNLTPDHLNRHGSMKHYAEIKQRIFARQMPADSAVLNADDALVREMSTGVPARVYWFSRLGEVDQGCFVRDGSLILRLNGQEQTICSVVDVKLLGLHNLENALAASLMAALADIPPAVIRYALKYFAGVEHRMEFVRELGGVRYVNDSKATNPDSAIKAVQSMHGPTILLAGGFDKRVSFDGLARALLEGGQVRRTVLFGQSADQIADALQEKGFTYISRVSDMAEALQLAVKVAEPGYTVLLSPACASFDQFTDYEERGRVFKHMVHALVPAGEGSHGRH
jgi:UDP-N-acetylmuramoylalanine--D-glutamate ligase